MFKNRVVARKACIMAGVDCTLPLTLSSLMRGWKPVEVEPTPIDSETHDNNKGE